MLSKLDAAHQPAMHCWCFQGPCDHPKSLFPLFAPVHFLPSHPQSHCDRNPPTDIEGSTYYTYDAVG